MFWQRQTLKYNILIPPINKPIEEFTPSEAGSFFEWFNKQIPYRIEYLRECCAEYNKISKNRIDLSPESLVLIWKWFLEIAETERTPEHKLKNLAATYSEHTDFFQEYLINQEKVQFSLQTEYILRDIGMYIGQVFVENNPTIYWGYYTTPKSDFFVNRPVLLGFVDNRFNPPFKTEFEPIHMVGVQAANIWDHTQKKEDLLNLYLTWNKFIPAP